MPIMTNHLEGLGKCPHCLIANPRMYACWTSARDGRSPVWSIYMCASCGGSLLAIGYDALIGREAKRIHTFPRKLHDELIDEARSLLRFNRDDQNTLSIIRHAVDIIVQSIGYSEGALYDRIHRAVEDEVLSGEIGQWAELVHFGFSQNLDPKIEEPYYGGATKPERFLTFAEALSCFLFVQSGYVKNLVENSKNDVP